MHYSYSRLCALIDCNTPTLLCRAGSAAGLLQECKSMGLADG